MDQPITTPITPAKPSAWKYPRRRQWAISIGTFVLTVASSFLPFTMYRDTIEPGDPTGSGCNCSYQYGGFPIPFYIRGSDLQGASLFAPTARAQVTVEQLDLSSLRLGCTPGCGVVAQYWPFFILDFALLFFAAFTVDYAAQKTGRRNRYWLLLIFLAVYVGVYMIASALSAYDYPGQTMRL